MVGVFPQERMSKRTVEQGPQVVEEVLAVVEVIPFERIFERIEEQIDDLPLPQVAKETLEVVNAITQGRIPPAYRGAEF